MLPESPEQNKDSKSLSVVLCWHMHQPQYLNLSSRQYSLPWTYLHGIKDYVDMAVYLEQNPKAKAVFNFAPILLEQLLDYSKQIQLFFSHNQGLNDPLLAALVAPALPSDPDHYLALVKQCLKANELRLIKRFPKYQELTELAEFVCQHSSNLRYTNGQFLSDLIIWYHLAWIAETTRKSDSRIIRLMEKGHSYSMHERLLLLRILGEQLDSIIPRYRALAHSGQIELSLSPYAHPILPLLLDFNNAKQALPGVELPIADHYPGGRERSEWHMKRGIEVFEACFGMAPKGCWPSEGAISNDTVGLLDELGFNWIASGEQVLQNSLDKNNGKPLQCTHHPFSLPDQQLRCFFRDDKLSDLIGFTYQDWHGDDAVNNLVHELEGIANANKNVKGKVVSIILDGENCWEYYPKNGYYFLTALYEKLGAHPTIKLTTFQDHIAHEDTTVSIPRMVSGSWVYGTLSTWIGNPDKNKAWDALVKAKRTFDRVMDSGLLDETQKKNAIEQLAICEGSDWFWWFGDYNPAESVSDFESLYRDHLSNLYRFLNQEIPEELTSVMSHGSGQPENAGVMRRSKG